jgi:hypothetical protein
MKLFSPIKLFILVAIFVNFSFVKYNPKSYQTVKNEISKYRLIIKAKFKKAQNQNEKNLIIEHSRKDFTDFLTNDIIPYWNGTKWSFEGHTEIPKVGNVACGYFVSTTLNHVGLKLNRFKLAQKSPENEAKTIQINKKIEFFQDISPETLKNHFVKNKKNGIYFIGLDFHVGYILKENVNVYFIHSNYIESAGVIKEDILFSRAIKSKKYYIADITYNDELIQKWISGDVIKT